MTETREIRSAMWRLSCIERTPYQYDPAGQVFGFGPIHYLVELGDQLYLAWHNEESGAVVVNPITRYDLDELDELGAYEPWTVLHVPAELDEGIRFREIDAAELAQAYQRMEGRTIAASTPPVMVALG